MPEISCSSSHEIPSKMCHQVPPRGSQRTERTDSVRWKRSHVENVNALHLAENFETFETSSLFEIGRDGTRLSTRREQVFFRLDLC